MRASMLSAITIQNIPDFYQMRELSQNQHSSPDHVFSIVCHNSCKLLWSPLPQLFDHLNCKAMNTVSSEGADMLH